MCCTLPSSLIEGADIGFACAADDTRIEGPGRMRLSGVAALSSRPGCLNDLRYS